MTSSQAGGRLRSRPRNTASSMCLRPVKHHTYPKISNQHYQQQNNQHHQQQPRQRSSLIPLVRQTDTLHKSSSFSGRKENSSPALSTRSSKKPIMSLLTSSTSVDFPTADVTVVKSASAGVRLNGKISRFVFYENFHIEVVFFFNVCDVCDCTSKENLGKLVSCDLRIHHDVMRTCCARIDTKIK